MSVVDEDHDRRPQRWVTVMALFTLLQGMLQLIGVSLGLSLYTCTLSIGGSFHWLMVRFYYFSNVHCRESYSLNNTVYHLDGVNNAAYRTMVIMSIYTALTSIWIIGSFLLLVSGIKGKHMRPFLGQYLQYPWTVSMIFVLILDVIAAVLYCIDLQSTSDFQSLMGLINIKPDGGMKEFEDRSWPPVIMALLTSKGVILWIFDTVIMIYLHKEFQKLFMIRQQTQFERAQITAAPEYLWPQNPQKKQLSRNVASRSVTPDVPPILPRLVSQDGRVMGAPNNERATIAQSSALQIAARQGFSYEHPKPSTWSPAVQPVQRMTSPQKYGYGRSDNWRIQNDSERSQENNRMKNILQRDNEVFY